jgi:AMP-polyphosphate phosphotransferase
VLDKIDLDLTLTKEEYKLRLPGLQQRIYALEWACNRAGIPSIILFEGWGGAGRGECIKVLTEKMDPRGYQVYPVVPPNTEEGMRPWMARFWRLVPGRGEMAIFDGSWYERVIWEAAEGTLNRKRQLQAFHDTRFFEYTLADDGVVILKLWLHISRKEQAKRLARMAKDPLEAWKVSKGDRWQNKQYPKILDVLEEAFDQTSTDRAPWVIVESENRYWARIKVLEKVAATLLSALRERGAAIPEEALEPPPPEKEAAS